MNKRRGERKFIAPDGNEYKLCLTLGAMAEIESELNLDSINQLDERLQQPKIGDFIVMLVALLKGGGHKDASPETVYDWPVEEVMTTVSDAMDASSGGDKTEGNG